MARYRGKDALTLRYQAGQRLIRAEFENVKQEVLNAALSEYDEEFDAALNRGEVLDMGLDVRDKIRQLLIGAHQKVLAPGSEQ